MMCDMILASPTATFGQPEINLGVSPGAGGTQRLTKIIGKYRAMEIMLTGKNISAKEAEQWGLVNRVVGEGEGEVVKEAVELAKKIASKGSIAVQATKEMVNAGKRSYGPCRVVLFSSSVLNDGSLYLLAYELPLSEGIRFERRLFFGLFSTNDKKEGKHHVQPQSFHSLPFPQRDAHWNGLRHDCVHGEAETQLDAFIRDHGPLACHSCVISSTQEMVHWYTCRAKQTDVECGVILLRSSIIAELKSSGNPKERDLA